MILLLLGLETLALFRLLCIELLLLLLESHVVLGVARVWRGKMLLWLNILSMHGWGWASVLDSRRRAIRSGFRTSSLVRWARGFGVWTSSLVCWASIVVLVGGMNCATFFGGYSSAFFERAGLLRSSDGRLTVI